MIDAIRSLLAAVSAMIGVFATVMHAPADQPVILRLNGVACAGPAYCLAVGQDVTHGRAFAELWDAGAWRVIPPPDRGSPEALWDVACLAVRHCLAVGTYSDGSGLGFTLAADWDGTRWRLLNPVSPGIDDQLGGLVCPRPNDCIAVGASLVTADRTLAERWDGKRWRVLATPPAGNPGALNAVACPRPARCVAVGSREGTDGMPRTLAEAWNGRQWRVLGTPTPPSGYGNLVDVSCARPDMCVATGYSYVPGSPAAEVITEEWDGETWRLLPFDSPTNADQVPGVACGPGPAGCVAVGDYLDSAGRGRTLAGLLDGTAGGAGWRMLRPAYPAGAEAVLTDIACPAPGRCIAVGDYDFTVGNLPFAELWDGRQWRLMTMPRA